MLQEDFNLSIDQLRETGSREAIVSLFANLGYNTETRMVQTSAAMGFSEALAHEITHIERVADHEAGVLQVYLLEMKRVTVALTQVLARVLRTPPDSHAVASSALYGVRRFSV